MKIAFFLNDFPVVSETFILNQIVGLLRRGHDVHIYAQGRGAQMPDAQHADIERYRLVDRIQYQTPALDWFGRLRGATTRIRRWGWRDPRAVADSLNVLRYRRSALNLTLLNELLPTNDIQPVSYDVIHCHFGPNGQRAVAWRNFGALCGPIITSFHGYDVNKLSRIYGPNLYKNLFRQGDLFTVGSEFLRSRIIALGAPIDRIEKLPMGVDLLRFSFSERTKSVDGEFRLLTVARLVEVKGIEYALLAVASLKEKCPGIRYQIIGDGPLRGELEALTSRLGLMGKVEFLGALSQEDVIQKMPRAHVFLLPSIVTTSGEEENQSVALAEAQASGLPVIATAIGGISDSMRDGESGFIVSPRNPEALASSLLWLSDHPEAWGRMGRAGRAQIEEHFNLERLNDRLVEIYGSVM
jgi:colanic acid/amylovoran biosynthesis glycosyltransferase